VRRALTSASLRERLSVVVSAVVLAIVSIAATGCRGRRPAAPSVESTPKPITVVGTERIGWNQAALSLAEANGFNYVAYVDGVRVALVDATCQADPQISLYACAARLPPMSPGAHRFELAIGRPGGTESARSAVLNVIVQPLKQSR